jgi:hypothetical protein
MRTVYSADVVSSDDDIPLQRWMRASGSGESMASRLPIMGQQVLVVATVLPPDPSVAALGASSGSSIVVDSAVVERATIEEEVVDDAAVARKVTNDAVVAKKAASDAATTKKVANVAATAKTAKDSVGSGSSWVPVAGSNRVTAPNDSTLPAKQPFLGSWKPLYVALVCSCYFLYRSCNLSD